MEGGVTTTPGEIAISANSTSPGVAVTSPSLAKADRVIARGRS